MPPAACWEERIRICVGQIGRSIIPSEALNCPRATIRAEFSFVSRMWQEKEGDHVSAYIESWHVVDSWYIPLLTATKLQLTSKIPNNETQELNWQANKTSTAALVSIWKTWYTRCSLIRLHTMFSVPSKMKTQGCGCGFEQGVCWVPGRGEALWLCVICDSHAGGKRDLLICALDSASSL